jgi:hypothetical protein
VRKGIEAESIATMDGDAKCENSARTKSRVRGYAHGKSAEENSLIRFTSPQVDTPVWHSRRRITCLRQPLAQFVGFFKEYVVVTHFVGRQQASEISYRRLEEGDVTYIIKTEMIPYVIPSLPEFVLESNEPHSVERVDQAVWCGQEMVACRAKKREEGVVNCARDGEEENVMMDFRQKQSKVRDDLLILSLPPPPPLERSTHSHRSITYVVPIPPHLSLPLPVIGFISSLPYTAL